MADHTTKYLRADPNVIYITELCETVDRSKTRVRHWVTDDVLPDELMPTRGLWRCYCWTPKQVEGILQWMKDNDMRMGKQIADPEKHPGSMRMRRRPVIRKKTVTKIKNCVERSYSRQQIIEYLFPEVIHTTKESFEKAIVNCCKYEGFPVPPRYLEISDLMSARGRQRLGHSLQEIVNALYLRTEYTDALELEGDLVRAYQLRDWKLPHSDPEVELVDKMTRLRKAEFRKLDKSVRAIEKLLDK